MNRNPNKVSRIFLFLISIPFQFPFNIQLTLIITNPSQKTKTSLSVTSDIKERHLKQTAERTIESHPHRISHRV